MNTLIKQIEKGKPLFDKIARNMYIGAIRDGFLTAMPVILFSSIFILFAAVPEIFGYAWPEPVSAWLWKSLRLFDGYCRVAGSGHDRTLLD